MKCPHCGYIHGWDGEKMEDIEGSAGDFLSVTDPMALGCCMRFHASYMYICPSCDESFLIELKRIANVHY